MHTMQQHLIALDAVLFDLVKLALELSLALQPLLSSTYIDDFPIDLLSIHFINCLENKRSMNMLPLQENVITSHDTLKMALNDVFHFNTESNPSWFLLVTRQLKH